VPLEHAQHAEPLRPEDTREKQNMSFSGSLSMVLELAIGIIFAKLAMSYFASSEEDGKQAPPPKKTRQVASRPNQKVARALLARSTRFGDAERVAMLLKGGADAGAADTWGCTALHIAADNGSLDAAKVLLDHGADVDVREAWEETPLHVAARSGNVGMCQLLLGRGAAVNAMDLDGQTPLITAARAGHSAICDLLLASGGGVEHMSDAELPPLLSTIITKQMLELNVRDLRPSCDDAEEDDTLDGGFDAEEEQQEREQEMEEEALACLQLDDL